MKRSSLRVLVLSALLVACSTSQPTAEPVEVATATPLPTAIPTPLAPTPTRLPPDTATPTLEPTAAPIDTPRAALEPALTPVLKQRINVGEYDLYIDCIGEGTPTVVLDSGLGTASFQWEAVISLIEDDPPTRVCFYDRLGLARSATLQVEKELRTNQDMVDDLHTLLVNANIPGPYILVPTSMSGFTALLYANQYPEEVAGAVFVDAMHPDFYSRMLALTPDADKTAFSDYYADPMHIPEQWDALASADQVRATGSLGALPLVVLTHDVNRLDLERRAYPSHFPSEVIEALAQEWLAMQEELAALSSNSTHTIVPDSTHNIPADAPESIVDAIAQVLAQIESG